LIVSGFSVPLTGLEDDIIFLSFYSEYIHKSPNIPLKPFNPKTF